MSSYKLKLNQDKTVTLQGLKHKPTGTVLKHSLSLHLLMKYPRLARGKIVSVAASELVVELDKYSKS